MEEDRSADDLGLELAEQLCAARANLVGFADLTVLPADLRPDLPRAVSIGLALDPAIIANIHAGPTRPYFEEYARANAALAVLCDLVARRLRAHGHQAHSFGPTTEQFDRQLLRTDFSHKAAATRAGLGWIGKCALLITPQFGSALRLATVATDARLPVGAPEEASRCGSCEACVTACPVKAPSGRHWRAGMMREEFYDAHACRRNALAMSAAQGIEATICGICIAACPWTRKYLRRN